MKTNLGEVVGRGCRVEIRGEKKELQLERSCMKKVPKIYFLKNISKLNT